MKFTDLPQNLKKEIFKLYILKGDDNFVIQSAIKHISNACGNEMGDFNKSFFNDENFSSEKVKEACLMLPIGNDRKFVLIKNVLKLSEAEKTNMLEIIKELPQTTTLVIVYNDAWKFLKDGEIVDCGKLGNDILSKYILVEASKSNKKITQEAILQLISLCNNNMTKISNELKKVICYCDNEISSEDINEIVEKDNEYQIYELSENLGKKKTLESIKILTSFLQKKEPFQSIFGLISNHFRRIIHSSLSNLSNAELANMFSVKEYAIIKAREQSKYFSKAQLKNILEILEETDNMVKSGKMSAENAIYYLVFKILYC